MSQIMPLEAERKKQGLSRDQLAGRAGISPGTIQNHERYGTTPHWSIQRVLAKTLGRDVDELFPDRTSGQKGGTA